MQIDLTSGRGFTWQGLHADLPFAHLYNSSTEARLLCQLLQRLSVWVVVLSKLSLHHLHVQSGKNVRSMTCKYVAVTLKLL